jgi:head-tail adaptor
MSLIAPGTRIAHRQKRIMLTTPGVAVPDGDGGYTQLETPLDPPALFGHVRPASVRDMERIAGSTTLPTASHLVTVPYHPQITTETVLHLEGHPRPDRVLKVVYVGNPDERNADLELICAEQVN